MVTADSILKWAGGKKAIRDILLQKFPKDFDTYIEPFCGGAAIALGSDYQNVVINDVNTDLINVYQCLKNKEYINICEYLKGWQENTDYLSEKFYYELRNEFNNKSTYEFTYKNLAHRSAQFIALNKLGFNGLYRVNAKGEFNVPWGKRGKNTKIYDKNKLEVIHKRLQIIDIYSGDYSNLHYPAFSFVYFDPPYDTESSNFTGYNKIPFGKYEQYRLAEFCDNLHFNKINVKFCQSNADTPFIRELYRNYRIVEIEAPRRISCNGDRTKAKELLIMNY